FFYYFFRIFAPCMLNATFKYSTISTCFLLVNFCSLKAQIVDSTSHNIDSNGIVIDSTANTDTSRLTKSNFSKFNFESVPTSKIDSTVVYPNIYDVLGVGGSKYTALAWKIDKNTFDLSICPAVDTSLFLNHLILPGQSNLFAQTYLGNMGSPIQSDNFFDRPIDKPFLFSKNYQLYQHDILSHKQFNVRSPHTRLFYSTGGKRREAEQILRVLHTQNVNRYLNFGVEYDYFSTKGIYENQLTRNNMVSVFASYYKKRISAQATFGYTYIRNQENGGLVDDKFIVDTVLEPSLVPFRLKNASSEVRQRSFAAVVGYDILTIKKKIKDEDGNDTLVDRPLLTSKLVFDANRHTRVYSDSEGDSTYYSNFFISTAGTHDSVYMVTYTTTLLAELSQLARFPGVPGLRFWVSNTTGSYYYYTPQDFIYNRSNDKLTTNHLGVGVFSKSPYLSYSGALRFYVNGYRSNEKLLFGGITISPWKSTEMPFIKGSITFQDRQPDLFVRNYFSNHYAWSNNFEREKWLTVSGVLGADRYKFEIGYNVANVVNYIYFDTTGRPAQASNVAITSAYVQKVFKVRGLYMVGKVLWQANTNSEVLSLPTLSGFGSIYYEYPLVKNVLTGQLGISVFYRTKFYADSYNPSTGQFINQREKKIGNYPFADVFANFKWKRANIFLKFEHVNQGLFSNEYFTALHYPANRRIFKFGVSWMFYD
ncbi:MAG TPA: hypothetical protein PK839_10245, partial [Tenuifilaceae bacterium]|nr:hypothetical protein [Tenuifilaceae bacterium]